MPCCKNIFHRVLCIAFILCTFNRMDITINYHAGKIWTMYLRSTGLSRNFLRQVYLVKRYNSKRPLRSREISWNLMALPVWLTCFTHVLAVELGEEAIGISAATLCVSEGLTFTLGIVEIPSRHRRRLAQFASTPVTWQIAYRWRETRINAIMFRW